MMENDPPPVCRHFAASGVSGDSTETTSGVINPDHETTSHLDNNAGPAAARKQEREATKIDHTYVDYSYLAYPLATHHDDGTPITEKKQFFPMILHKILADPANHDIIRWDHHGRSWKVFDKDKLAKEVCPKYFKHDKFESFNRSVNGWGFKRLAREGPDCRSYYHPFFLRSRHDLAVLVKRTENIGRRLPNVDDEPDFYNYVKYPPMPQLSQLPSPPMNTTDDNHKNENETGGLLASDGAIPRGPPVRFHQQHQHYVNSNVLPSGHFYGNLHSHCYQYPKNQFFRGHPVMALMHPIYTESHVNEETLQDHRQFHSHPRPPHYTIIPSHSSSQFPLQPLHNQTAHTVTAQQPHIPPNAQYQMGPENVAFFGGQMNLSSTNPFAGRVANGAHSDPQQPIFCQFQPHAAAHASISPAHLQRMVVQEAKHSHLRSGLRGNLQIAPEDVRKPAAQKQSHQPRRRSLPLLPDKNEQEDIVEKSRKAEEEPFTQDNEADNSASKNNREEELTDDISGYFVVEPLRKKIRKNSYYDVKLLAASKSFPAVNTARQMCCKCGSNDGNRASSENQKPSEISSHSTAEENRDKHGLPRKIDSEEQDAAKDTEEDDFIEDPLIDFMRNLLHDDTTPPPANG